MNGDNVMIKRFLSIKNILCLSILFNLVTIILLAISINWFITTNDNIDNLGSQLAMFELNTTKPQKQNLSSLESYMSEISSTVEDNADALEQIKEHLRIMDLNLAQIKRNTVIR
jgi:peptidoglycan hydrolase CwlO-like protein